MGHDRRPAGRLRARATRQRRGPAGRRPGALGQGHCHPGTAPEGAPRSTPGTSASTAAGPARAGRCPAAWPVELTNNPRLLVAISQGSKRTPPAGCLCSATPTTDTAAGLLTRPDRRTRNPRPPGGLNAHCPGMTSLLSHGRQRQEHPETQSLRHCAWRLPTSGAAVLIAGGRGGQTGSEYGESSPPASGLARHCMPPRRPGQVRMLRRRQDRLPAASKRRQTG